MAKKLIKTRMQLVGLLFLPLFILQFINLISWIAAKPLELLEYENMSHVSIPEGAESYYLNHGSAEFNSHGVISDEPLAFAFWVFLFAATFLLFVAIQKKMEKTDR